LIALPGASLFGFGEKRGAAVEGPRGGEGWGGRLVG
jgi:hypothetical protein